MTALGGWREALGWRLCGQNSALILVLLLVRCVSRDCPRGLEGCGGIEVVWSELDSDFGSPSSAVRLWGRVERAGGKSSGGGCVVRIRLCFWCSFGRGAILVTAMGAGGKGSGGDCVIRIRL